MAMSVVKVVLSYSNHGRGSKQTVWHYDSIPFGGGCVTSLTTGLDVLVVAWSSMRPIPRPTLRESTKV